MNSQHTPGPWIVEKDYQDEKQHSIPIVAAGQGYIAGIHLLKVYGDNPSARLTETDRANACLIAAAPELLGSLQVAEGLLSQSDVRHYISSKLGEQAQLHAALTAMRTAITNALHPGGSHEL